MEIKNIMKNTYAAFLSAITYKCGRVVLSRTSAHFAISKLILLFSYSFHVPCIILSNVYFYIIRSMFLFPFNRSQLKASVVNQMSHLFFSSSKIFFWSFQLFENGHIQNVVSTSINVVKLDVRNNNIVLALPNVVNTNVEIDNINWTFAQLCKFQRVHTQRCFNVDSILSNIAKSYHPNNSVETTLKCFLSIEECC